MWTLDELGARVRDALAVGYEPAQSGRIRAVPDRRTIRYYTTLGLIDRPKAMRGRTALYGRKHLLQLVAIKRLQAEGQTLSQVQSRLAGLTVRALSGIARVSEAETSGVETPAESKTAALRDGAPGAGDTARRRSAFWSATPAATPASVSAVTAEVAEPAPAPAPPTAEALTGLRLDEAVTLLLRTTRGFTPAETQALGELAQPLMNYLRNRGLLFGDDGGSLPSLPGEEKGGC
jgi:DNA-binding transcriptional MerR regulator